jgi:hypothetical protein
MLSNDASTRRFTPPPTNNTHKQSIVIRLLYTVYYTSHIHINISVLNNRYDILTQRTALSFVTYYVTSIHATEFVAIGTLFLYTEEYSEIVPVHN